MSTEDKKITAENRREVDGNQLTEDIGIDRREIDWRKEFTGFGPADEERLSAMSDTFDRIAEPVVEEFYDHLKTYDETVEIINYSTKSVDQLKQSQRRYLTTLGSGDYDQGYFQRRARIGKIHDMLDLGPKIYLGAYSIYYQGIMEAIAEDVKEQLVAADGGAAMDSGDAAGGMESALSPEEAIDEVVERSMSALKLLNLDQQIAMDTYIHSYSKELERELDQQQAVAENVETAVSECQTTTKDVVETTDYIDELAADQAESMEEVSGEVGTMSATVEEIASTAEEVAATSQRAEDLAEDGQKAADAAKSTMHAVNESSAQVAGDVDDLQDRIEEIDQIVEVINDIAEQTNMLALNASIEAARAGEAGEGFAVVADEVKSLAEESQDHAGEIEAMVDEIKGDTADTVQSLEATTEQVEQGMEEVGQAMDTLQEIVDAVKETSTGIQEVSEATDDQAASTEEVASMIDELVEQAEEVSDEIADVAAANEEQAAKVTEINQTVNELVEE